MTLSEWKSKGEFFSYNSHKIFNIDEGEGEVLLLIHGFPTASWDWWQMWPDLLERYRLITLDMIGFGFSAKPKNYPYSIFDQSDLIEQILSSKGVTQVKILAHDYGDTVAQELLARFNERQTQDEEGVNIESLCFLNGGLFPETHKALLIQKLLMSPIGGFISKFMNRDKLAKSFRKIFGPNTQPTQTELDEFWELIAHNDGQLNFHLLIRYMQERSDNRERWVGAIQKATIPIRLINGVFDPISGGHMADRYLEIIPNADVVRLDGIGHFPLIESPKLVLQHYLEFVG